MNAHAAQRARERLGVQLTDQESRKIIAAIQSGWLIAVPAKGDRRAWFKYEIQGAPAWVLYDYGARSIVTILDKEPYELGQPLPTLYALADEYGVSHAEAKRIAGREYEHLRHAHKSDRLTGMQAQKLRPLFEAAAKKPEEAPIVEKSEGYALSLIVQKTGLGESKIKMILSRHAELQELPYSTKAGGARVFFDPFVEWLANYEGKEESQKSRPVTSVTKLPAGAQLRELRLMAEKKFLTPAQIQRILGVEDPPTITVEERPAPLAIAEKGFAQLRLIAEGGQA